jgi:hypothetical protein
MSDEKDFTIQPPDPDNQLPPAEEPAGQIEPPSGGAEAFEMPAGERTEVFYEPVPPVEEPRISSGAYVTPPIDTPVPPKKNNRTIWIIVVVVLLVLCCCCLLIVGIVAFIMPFQNSIEWSFLPALSQFI